MLITSDGPIVPTGAGASRTPLDRLPALNEAARLLRLAGFKPIKVSMRSDSVYYGMDGFHGLLRVAAHKADRRREKQFYPPVIARLGVGMHMTATNVRSYVETAIGQYVLAHAERTIEGASE